MAEIPKAEVAKRWSEVTHFFHEAEKRNLRIAEALPGVVVRLLAENENSGGGAGGGNQELNAAKLKQSESLLGIGVHLLGKWMGEQGFGGFNHNLTLVESGMLSAATVTGSVPVFPDRATFLASSGVPYELREELAGELVRLSKIVGQALECMPPRQVIAGLVYFSLSRKDPGASSDQMRALLERLIPDGSERARVLAVLFHWGVGREPKREDYPL